MSIQTVEISLPESIIKVIEIRQGPVGGGGGGSNNITSATTSDGTANLSLSNVTTATATVTSTLTADHIHGNLAGNVYGHVRAGEALAKGDPVYVSGSHGSGSTLIPIVSKADASNAAKMPAIGIMDAAVANNSNGHMVIVGTITELNTAAYSVNAELYVASGGGFTSTPPTARAQPVARVERANTNNGAVIVKVNGLSASDATASTLVRRTSDGGASFYNIVCSEIDAGSGKFQASTLGNVTFGSGATINFNATTYTYGTGAASAHRIALGAGTTGALLFQAGNIAQLDAAMGITTLKKTSDQAFVNNSNTAVTEMSFAMQANVRYRVWGEFIMQSTVATIGFKSEINFPTVDSVKGATWFGWMQQPTGTVAGVGINTTTRSTWFPAYTGAAAVRRLPFDITLFCTTSGTFSILAAQNSTDAVNPSYVKAGSFLKYQIIDA